MPPAPLAYGILQSASAYMGSRKPFFTPKSSEAVQAVFDSYQLIQLQMAILLTNYRLTLPGATADAIRTDVVAKITSNIEQQRSLLKPPVPADSFVDLRTTAEHPDMLLWGPSRWVSGASLEPSCTDRQGQPTKWCDSPIAPADPSAGFATDEQLKALVDGWEGETPLSWLEEHTDVPISRAPAGTPAAETGFLWVGPQAVLLHCVDPFCNNHTDGNWYEWLKRYDLKDTTKPSPTAWSRQLHDLDAQNYAATAFNAPTPVAAGTYFWPVGG
jgi:hypothetical protein